MSNSKSKTRMRAFAPPPLVRNGTADLPAGDADALWQLGHAAEEEFDYDAAHQLYREAAHRATPREAAEYVCRYAAFLVERYGQFGEVAAWLDHDAFDPLAASTEEGAPELARLVATAAAESGHPRLAQLDDALARRYGDSDSLTRRALELAANGAAADARQLLEEFAARLEPLSEARRLLEELRADAKNACIAALAEVNVALDQRDAAAARLALEQERRQWQHEAAFRAAESQVRDAERTARAETLRRQLEQALDADDLPSAKSTALELVALLPDSAADRNSLTWIEDQLSERDRADRVAGIATVESIQDAISQLQDLLGVHGAEVEIPGRWQATWDLVCEAARLQPEATDTVSELAAVAGLDGATEAADRTARLQAIAPRWRGLAIVRRAAATVEAARDEANRVAEARTAAEVERLLRQGDTEGASETLRRHASVGERGPLLKELHKTVETRKAQVERHAAMVRELRDRLASGRLFAARRMLGRLQAEPASATDIAPLRQEMAARWQADMVAAAVPPVGLAVSDEPFAVGVVAGRLLIVQGRLWLTVNLETSGLQPFQLPESCEIASRPTARIAEVDGRAVLIGFSRGRLLRIEQGAGDAPEVLEGANLDKLLRGDDRIAGAAIEPGASSWQLLHRHSGRPEANSTISHIDAATMKVQRVDRHRPALASLRGVRNRPDAFLVASTADARARRGWAVALYDGAQQAQASPCLTQQELGEPVARLTKAIAWPDADRLYASYSVFDVFNPAEVQATSSLLVLRGDKLVFASADLRRRFAPTEKLVIDHPWTLDTRSGRLWFAALPRADADDQDAMLLGVDAERLRADPPATLKGVQRVLAIEPWASGAVALCRMHAGQLAVARAHVDGRGDLALTIDGLPV